MPKKNTKKRKGPGICRKHQYPKFRDDGCYYCEEEREQAAVEKRREEYLFAVTGGLTGKFAEEIYESNVAP